jgi:phosphomannomutase/phosphoglucomutase
LIASLSGIRGVYNQDLSPAQVAKLAANFGRATGSNGFLLARDTRPSGPAMSRAALAGLLSLGVTVYDYGIATTPAIFRESRIRKLPAVMVTASHNEPRFNGLKFVVDGAGIGRGVFETIVSGEEPVPREFGRGAVKQGHRPKYVDDLVARFGAGSARGVRVAADLGGGAAIVSAVNLLTRMGCEVTSLNDSCGVFTRLVDPVADDLTLLRKVVKAKGCDVGLGFDCDGDRLVIVDSDGRKRTGDHMLALALSELLAQSGEKKVVVSVDTSQAIDDIALKLGCQVFRSKVGEANVVGKMREHGARLGGEGSSGGVIDGAFNYCRDSMLAALAIICALRVHGREFYDSVPTYRQVRVALEIPKARAERALRKIASEYPSVDTTDGLKINLPKRTWVLIRPSGTEDVVRVSAESVVAGRAEETASYFAKKLKGLSR